MDRAQRTALTHEEAEKPGSFGCPMLVSVQWEHAAAMRVPTSRCLIGWSLTDGLAIARCRATHAVIDCWKAHPERAPVVAPDEPPLAGVVLHVAAAD